MPNSQSHLFSLANLLESAEARHSAMPPPPVSVKNDSGLIDLIAIQNRAREERTQAATPTPVPMTLPSSSAGGAPVTAHRAGSASYASGPDFLALDAQRRRKNLLMGAITGSVALVVFASVVAFSSSGSAPPAAAVRSPITTTLVAPSPPPPPPAAPVAVAPPPEPVAAAAAPEVAAVSPPAKRAKSRKHSSGAKGPKMVKVASGGTAH